MIRIWFVEMNLMDFFWAGGGGRNIFLLLAVFSLLS